MSDKKRILWINPLYTDVFDQPLLDYMKEIASPDTELDVISFAGEGPSHNEYNCYEMWMMRDLLLNILQAERQGYDAAVIGCFYDPGIRAARELAQKMAVIGPAEACLRIASTLGEKISIIVGRRKWIPEMEENAKKYGCAERIASFRVLDMGVHDFQKNPEITKERILKEARAAVSEDHADVIVLGCTIEFGFFADVQKELGIPVVEAVAGPLKYAEFLADLQRSLGWGHSKLVGYESPPREELLDFGILG